MKCPNCRYINLVLSEKHGIEIEYCPKCRGIWLDRGELNKIIDKSIITETGIDSSVFPQEYKGKDHTDYDAYHNK